LTGKICRFWTQGLIFIFHCNLVQFGAIYLGHPGVSFLHETAGREFIRFTGVSSWAVRLKALDGDAELSGIIMEINDLQRSATASGEKGQEAQRSGPGFVPGSVSPALSTHHKPPCQRTSRRLNVSRFPHYHALAAKQGEIVQSFCAESNRSGTGGNERAGRKNDEKRL
jgi:hypothetical protein